MATTKKVATTKEATLRLYFALNSPSKAGAVWVQYRRETIDAALDVLKQMLATQGFEFRKRDDEILPPNAGDKPTA